MTWRNECERDWPTEIEAARDLAEDRKAYPFLSLFNYPSDWPLTDPWAQQQIAIRRNRA